MTESPKKEQSFRLPQVVKSLGWVSLLTDAAGDMVYPLIAPFLRSMGAGGVALGVLEGVSEGIGALVKWRWGAFADRTKHRKRLVVLGYAIATAARPLLSLAAVPWHVIALRSTDRIGKGVRSAPRDTILAAAVEPAYRAQAFGFHQMMDNLGAGLGPLIAFGLAEVFDWSPRRIFAFSAVPGVLALLVLVLGVKDDQAASEPLEKKPKPPSAPLTSGAKRYLAALFVFTLGASADSFLLLRLSKLGLADALIPLAWLSLNLSKAATNMPGGRISDRLGHKRTLVIAWTFYAVMYGLFPLMTTTTSAWLLMLVYGGYYGLSEGGEKAIVVELVPEEQRGRALGAMHGLTGAGVVLANASFGILFEWDFRAAFWASSAMAILGAVGLGLFVPTARKAA